MKNVQDVENVQKNALKKSFISHKWDILLGAVLLITALCLFLVFKQNKKDGKYVKVEQDGKVVGCYPLDEDGKYKFTNFYGSNTLIIQDGKAYVTESTCSDHTCEKMGKVYRQGEMIICIPHKLFITVTGDSKKGGYDGISG